MLRRDAETEDVLENDADDEAEAARTEAAIESATKKLLGSSTSATASWRCRSSMDKADDDDDDDDDDDVDGDASGIRKRLRRMRRGVQRKIGGVKRGMSGKKKRKSSEDNEIVFEYSSTREKRIESHNKQFAIYQRVSGEESLKLTAREKGSVVADAQWAKFFHSRIAHLFKFSFLGHLHIAEILKSGFSSV